MSFFCLLWVPMFYFLRRSFTDGSNSGSVLALFLGSLVAIIKFYTNDLVSPGGFGFSRWLFGFIEIVSLPVLIPLFIYLIIKVIQGFSGDFDFVNFSLLWMIPVAAFQALSWSSSNDPILLIAVPLLWTALSVGISFFIHWVIESNGWYMKVLAILFILILPILGAGSYWAFFSQQTMLGFILFFVTQIPFVLSFIRR